MKKHFLSLLLCFSMIFPLTGCGETEVVEEEPEFEFDNIDESSNLGISCTDKNILTKLENNTYYVKHNNIYYPLYVDEKSEHVTSNELEASNTLNASRLLYYSSENEKNIPTLYAGDKLIYYSTDTLLDYLTWERFYDAGYTLGLVNMQPLTSGRYYIDLTDKDNYPILNSCPLSTDKEIQKKADNILIDRIGGITVDDKLIDHGFIGGLTKDQEYDIDLYTGTYYAHYTLPANYHVFYTYELFASIKYLPVQEYIYEVEIPDYFVNGYYYLNNVGLVRYVTDKSYNSDTDFNKQLLYPDLSYSNGEHVYPRCYSEFEELNYFTSEIPGTLGYVDPDQEKVNEFIENQEKNESTVRKSVIKTFDLWLPKNQECSIKVNSKSKEKTGSIQLTTDSTEKQSSYDYIENEYKLLINGKGEKATLTINGFYNEYEIELIGAEEYYGQDVQSESPELNNEDSSLSSDIDIHDDITNEEDKSDDNDFLSTIKSKLTNLSLQIGPFSIGKGEEE